MVEVQCSSCHTRYRVDEQVLPEGTPTFKCSRCGHVFTIEPRGSRSLGANPAKPKLSPRSAASPDEPSPEPKTQPAAKADSAAAVTAKATPAEPESPPPLASAAPAKPNPAPPATPTPVEASNKKISTAELLARSFVKTPDTTEGDNLTFDFHEEPEGLEEYTTEESAKSGVLPAPAPPSARWAVGPIAETPAASEDLGAFAIGDPPTPIRNRTRAGTRSQPGEFVDETEAPLYNSGVLHSARFFLGLLLFVLTGFAAATITIHAAPAAGRELLNQLPIIGGRFTAPQTPARMVALHDVRSTYQRGKDGRQILIITGQAANVTRSPLHAVGVAATLGVAAGRPPARREVYCGNNLVARTIAEMTSHEIDFFQGLPPPPGFTLDPSASCPFVIVFTQATAPASHFALTITKADAPAAKAS